MIANTLIYCGAAALIDVVLGAAIAYLAFATAFGGEAFRLVGAVAIIVLGLALVAGGLADRLSRKGTA